MLTARQGSSCGRPTALHCGSSAGATTISADALAPSWRLLRHPAHFISFGAGAGLVPFAPGTAGTLVAFPLYWLLAAYTTLEVSLAAVAAAFAVGIWACGATG